MNKCQRNQNRIIKLGEFENNSRSYVVFFNEASLSLDYFYFNEEYNDVECHSLHYLNARNFIKSIKTFEDLVLNYKKIWRETHLTLDVNTGRMFNVQTFPAPMWKDCVLTNFKGLVLEAFLNDENEEKRAILVRTLYEKEKEKIRAISCD